MQDSRDAIAAPPLPLTARLESRSDHLSTEIRFSCARMFERLADLLLALEANLRDRALARSAAEKLLEECFPVFGIEVVPQFFQG